MNLASENAFFFSRSSSASVGCSPSVLESMVRFASRPETAEAEAEAVAVVSLFGGRFGLLGPANRGT